MSWLPPLSRKTSRLNTGRPRRLTIADCQMRNRAETSLLRAAGVPSPRRRPLKRMAASRRAVLREQLAGRDLVELVEPDAERLVLVADRVEVRPEVEQRQLGPAARGDEVDFPGVESERAEDLRVLELLLGVPGAVDPPEHLDPPRIGHAGSSNFSTYFQYCS